MLIKKEVKAGRKIILFVVMIFSLIISIYLFSVNINSSNRQAGKEGMSELEDQLMSKIQISATDSLDVSWQSLEIEVDVLTQSKVKDLEQVVKPLTIEKIPRGKKEIFKSIFIED